jgi:DNA-directed RNA polymerase subunit RPC12/RpoP
MFSFCPHCGQTIGGTEQIEGQMLVCRECGKPIGIVAAPKKVMVDQTEELIRKGTAARCPHCNEVVEVNAAGTLVPHYAQGRKKICPGSGKPLKPVEPAPIAGGKDLHALMTRDVIKVVLCQRGAEPGIEELTLEYLDKADRVRLQIEALREILGQKFRIQPYPPQLGKPDFALWAGLAAFVVAKKHERGGFQQMNEIEAAGLLADIRNQRSLFSSDD